MPLAGSTARTTTPLSVRVPPLLTAMPITALSPGATRSALISTASTGGRVVGVGVRVTVAVGVSVTVGVAVIVALAVAVVLAVTLAVDVAVGVLDAVAVGLAATTGQPRSALATAAMISSIDTPPLLSRSTAGHAVIAAEPSAMFTPVMSSLMTTMPSPLQSPAQVCAATGAFSEQTRATTATDAAKQ